MGAASPRGLPGGVALVARQGLHLVPRTRSQVLLAGGAVLIDDEGHYPGAAVVDGPGQEGESPRHLAVHHVLRGPAGRHLALEDPEVVAVERGGPLAGLPAVALLAG